MPWLHGLAGLAALGCGLMALSGNARATDALTHPLVIIPAAVFALSILLLPTVSIPALSIFGAPEHGFGALVYLDLAALTASAFLVLADPRWRRLVLGGTFFVIVVVFGLDDLFREKHTWAPFFFSDYLAFYAVFAFAILGVMARGRTLVLLGAGAILISLSLLSANKAALLAILAALTLLPVVLRADSKRTVAALCFAYPVVVGVAIVVVGSTWQESYRFALLTQKGFGPFLALLTDSWTSVWSRAMLVVVGAQTLIDHPWRLFVGIGWGHYNEALLANLSIVEGRLHEMIGPPRVYWDAIRRADFHSHNQYFESLLSGGIGSAALVLAYGAAIVRCAPPDRRKLAFFVVLILSILQSFWFQMPHSIPVMALAVAMLVEDGTRYPFAHRRLGPVLAAGASAAALVLAVGGATVGLASRDARLALRDIQSDGPLGRDSKVRTGFFAGLGELIDAALLQTAYERAIGGAETPSAASESRDDAVSILLSRVGAAENPASLKLSISTINVLSGIVFTVPDFAVRFAGIEDLWGRRVDDLMRRAPRRSDIAVPYFNYLLAHGRETEVLDLANSIFARHRDDAVALWFSGVVLLGSTQTGQEGLNNLKKSLALGIRNIMPVDPATIKSIEQ